LCAVLVGVFLMVMTCVAYAEDKENNLPEHRYPEPIIYKGSD
jgi:hypothetical protein